LQNKLTKTEHYSPAEDSIFFANYIAHERGKNALDIGTGSGYLAKVLLPNFNFVVATDISFDSIKEAHTTINNCVCCNAAEALRIEFDLVICNMPYLSSNEIVDATVDGLHEGLEVPLGIIKSARNVLKKNGKMIFLTSSLANYVKLITMTESLGFQVKIVATKKLFFEELILVQAIK
jgi:release factor glutamine methyltransferase